MIRVPKTFTELLYDGFEFDTKAIELQQEITTKCYLYRRSLFRGYITRKTDSVGSYAIKIYKYKGMYGKGYAIFSPNLRSENYVYVKYWIERDNE